MTEAIYAELLSADGILRPESVDAATEPEAETEAIALPELTLERMVLPNDGSPLEISIREELQNDAAPREYHLTKNPDGYVPSLHYSTFSLSYASGQEYTFIRDEPRILYQTETRSEPIFYLIPVNRQEEASGEREAPYREKEAINEIPYQRIPHLTDFRESSPHSASVSHEPELPISRVETHPIDTASLAPMVRIAAIVYQVAKEEKSEPQIWHLLRYLPENRIFERMDTDFEYRLETKSRETTASVSPTRIADALYEAETRTAPIDSKVLLKPRLDAIAPLEMRLSVAETEPILIPPHEWNAERNLFPSAQALEEKVRYEQDKTEITSCRPAGAYLEKARRYRAEHPIAEEAAPLVPQKKLMPWIRDGVEQRGFRVAEEIVADRDYANVYEALRALSNYTLEFRVATYVDTETGRLRTGVYLYSISEFAQDANALGMAGQIILFVDGIEPGQGKADLNKFPIKAGQTITPVYKAAEARYLPQLIAA